MDKEKMDACKQRIVDAAHWGKSQLTPKRLKKGAGCLLALAIVAGGGKVVLHQQKAQAHAQEAQARTEMLQNLAAQKNIQLVSTDQVKENIATTLGTDPSSITFQSVTLDDRKPGDKFPGKDDKEHKEKKNHKKESKENKKDSKKYKENDRKDRDGRQDQMQPGQIGQQGQPPMMPGSQRPEGMPGRTRMVCSPRGSRSPRWPKKPGLMFSPAYIWPSVQKTACGTASWWTPRAARCSAARSTK